MCLLMVKIATGKNNTKLFGLALFAAYINILTG
jgi:hypothetical protein